MVLFQFLRSYTKLNQLGFHSLDVLVLLLRVLLLLLLLLLGLANSLAEVQHFLLVLRNRFL